MTLFFVGLLVLIILGIYILLKVTKIQRQIQSVVTEFQENPREKAAEVAFSFGAGIANVGAKKIHEAIEKKQSKEQERE